MNGYPDPDLAALYRRCRTIAVVGASHVPAAPAYYVPEYLQALGYRILPVHPTGGEILGEAVYRRLGDVDAPVDIVSVFRLPRRAEVVVHDAVAIGATVLWYQPGTDIGAAVRLACRAGLFLITRCCIGATHAELGVGPAGRPATRSRRHCAGHRPYRRRHLARS